MAKEKKVKEKKVKETQERYIAPDIRPGSIVKVSHKIYEGDKERLTTFQGTVIKMRGVGEGKTITVRKISRGIGVERIFPLNSPIITKIEVTKQTKVRRAKLYYLRKKKGQEAKLKEA